MRTPITGASIKLVKIIAITVGHITKEQALFIISILRAGRNAKTLDVLESMVKDSDGEILIPLSIFRVETAELSAKEIAYAQKLTRPTSAS